MLAGDDLSDGYQANSRSADIQNFFNLRLNFNIGNKEKRTEPLYWVNPLDAPMNDIAELKQRPKFDLTDTDGDGVIDMIDQEPESMAGCPVDTRGITLDSDGDGIVDCKDEEPYSPPGYTVNDQGVANVTTPYLTESEVRAIVNERPLPKTEWFLPMVHFDLDKYYIKPQYYGALANVSQVLKAHPNLSLVVTGYHDNRGSADYNNVLAYNRAEAVVNALVEKMGVSRDRLYIQYSDEQLIDGLPSNYGTSYTEERAQYMNRRVEFAIADGNASNASRPEGEAGSNTPGSARDGDKFSGNRNSGY
jgi:outer membrane protein OmpA-like peptidoglycan-associated protein